MIKTHILNWSVSSKFTKMWKGPKNCMFGAMWIFRRVKPVATVSAQFQPGPGTELWIWNCC